MTDEALKTRSFNIALLDRFYGIFLVTCAVVLVIGVPFVFVRKTVTAAIALFLIAAVLAAMRLNRKGYPEKSLVYFSIGFWFALVLMLYGGLPPVTAASALAISVVLAVVVNTKAGAIFGGSYMFAWLGYIVLQTFDLAPTPYFIGAKFAGWFFGVVAVWLVLLPIPAVIQQLRRATSLQQAVIESTTDGILVVNLQGHIQTYNQRFVALWCITNEFLQENLEKNLLEIVAVQLIDPVQFLSRVKNLHSNTSQESVDALIFKDGRTFEQYSRPVLLNGAVVGHVWSFRDVTQRNRSQQRLDIAIDITKVMLWELDMTNDQLSFDHDKLQTLGFDVSFVPKTLDELIESVHPLDQSSFREKISAVSQSADGEFDFEYRVRIPSAQYQWIHSKGRIVQRSATGLPIRAMGTSMNISHRKKIEEDLRRNVQLLQSILDNVPVGLSAFDKQQNLIASNKLFQINLELPDSLVGGETTTFRDIIQFNAQRGEYGEGNQDQIVQSIIERASAPFPHQIERVRPNGVTLDIRGAPMLGGGFVVTYDDISERKQSELEVKRSEQLLRGAIDSVDEAFALYDADDRLALCNDKFRQMFSNMNYTIELGSTFESMIRQGAEHGRYPEAIGRIEEWIYERLHIHQQGGTILAQPLNDGRILRIKERKLSDGSTVGFRMDITDLMRATQTAQEANIAKSRFLATMSHEIRTPMNGILGMAQLLLMPNLSTHERRDYARTILSSGQTLLTLLNDILDLSKIEAGKFQLDSVVFDPASVIRETKALFAGAAKAKNLLLEGDWRGTFGQRFQTDAHRLRQMLSNLVGNAIKFTPAGQILIEAVEIERYEETAVLEFSVVDSGIGIETDKLDLLFKPFSQTDSSTTRKFGGTGLGLSIVSNLAKAMGGDVGVESQPEKGSRFWFRIRVKMVESDSRQIARDQNEHQPASSESFLNGHVLVVEDNPVNCMVIEAMLTKLGLSLTVTHDGQQALDVITQGDEAPDIILMDLHMPVMDGYTAVTHIRQWEFDQNRTRLPIIALTADAFEEDHKRCISIGMDDFLTKPISIDALKSALLQWLPIPTKNCSITNSIPFRLLSPVEQNQVNALIEELTPLLANNKYQSLSKLFELQKLAEGTKHESDIKGIEEALENFRFDLALERLQHLTASQTEIFTFSKPAF